MTQAIDKIVIRDETTVPELWEALGNLRAAAHDADTEATRLTRLGCTDAAKPHAERWTRLHERIDSLLWEIAFRETGAVESS